VVTRFYESRELPHQGDLQIIRNQIKSANIVLVKSSQVVTKA